MCWESCVEAGFFNCFSGLVDHSGREDGKSARVEGRVQEMIEGVQWIKGRSARDDGKDAGEDGKGVRDNGKGAGEDGEGARDDRRNSFGKC